MNLLTKLHEDRTVNVASRAPSKPLLTRKNAPPPGGHFHDDRKINVTSRVLTRKNAPPPWWPYIIGMNLLTEFHEDRTIYVASRVLTRFYYSHIRKNAPPLGSHVFQANVTIFKLIQDINKTNLLTKFHEDWTINVASRVLTRFYYSHIRKNAPPPGRHVFQPTVIIFKLEKCPAPWQPCFSSKGYHFELIQDIIGTNLLSKFHEDRKINVASRGLTRKNAPPHGSHVFQANTNLLTKFHEDWTINVASRELTRQMLTQHNARRTTDKRRSQKLTMSTLCSGFEPSPEVKTL
ncbi:hypothetical protein DPMN_040874 [Dreissena polymorpha]|uniref:Uncharacterized protein n=1 Tax=Dreissena polymorpha TaxID=45954 RepID=A0A9D4CYF5_DREPO|nr:hypothetical protein DPMN_040874 [Dreissena polymorpha]